MNGGATSAPSNGWLRKPLIQSRCSVEWCTAWKRHRNGTSWLQRWAQYDTRSNSTTPSTSRGVEGSIDTSGRTASPGSHARLATATVTATAVPATTSSGWATA